jgi:nucleoside-diphosphate-sugar epimerase
MANTALIIGVSGITGNAVANLLVERGWRVQGLARSPVRQVGVDPLVADLLNPRSLEEALAATQPSHIFFAAWARQATEAENIRVNAGMVRNVLEAVRPLRSVHHVALVTGLKHYLGPFESYGKGNLPPTPFREEQERLDIPNFYYAQEDEVFSAAERDGFTWSVHRSHTMIGLAVGNAMNMGTTLAVLATICRETGRPFQFPGSAVQWNSLTDMTDAGLLARHLLWASTTPAAANKAFNVVNGDVFRWSWMWSRIADWFGIDAAPFDGSHWPLEKQMANDAPLWQDIAKRYELAESNIHRLASPWHTDADLGRPIEVVTDMSRSRELGFLDYRATDAAFYALFEQLRARRLIS